MKNILVVDDEENLRHLFEGELSEEGYSVETARGAEEALVMIASRQPDLVTLDIKMPGMGGKEALRVIREKYPDIAVVMLTAFTEFKADFDLWSADAYVVKSSDLTELKTKIRYLLLGE